MWEDPLFWLFVLPGLLLGMYAQSRIKVNMARYARVSTEDGITGAEVARRLLDSQGLQNVAIEVHSGGIERSLRSPFQGASLEPGGILCTERSGCGNCGS